ncbi:hypothetical protein CBS101457_001517 [Exobasidium rhododendri]|nr:hypothetical protein CBS101457_001517 [Exobasidium rhododendri]
MEVSGHGHNRHSSGSNLSDTRPAYLDRSALSPTEYGLFFKWLATIKPSRSGKADYLDEQDALRFLREECGIEVQDEIKIMSLFERFPSGLLPGHFFALLRLAAWVQRGESPSRTMLFIQASPPKTGLKSGEPILPPTHHAAKSPRQISHNFSSPKAVLAPSKAIEVIARSIIQKDDHVRSSSIHVDDRALPPIPDEGSKPPNPFRQSAPPQSSNSGMLGSAIFGFDPAPNPFKQSKPKLVRPTPIVADASTSVLGAPSMPIVNPFQSGHSASSSASNSPMSGRSLLDAGQDPEHDQEQGPPLPPRPLEGMGMDLRPPPPLPPRHISPLIQAGLNARSEVKKRKEALPPKTFTVLQSTSDRHHPKEAPRLLTGQAAPPALQKRKSLHGSEHRRSITELYGSALSATGGGGGAHSTKVPIHMPAGLPAPPTVVIAPTPEPHPSSEHAPSNRVGPLPPTIAPKASYGGKGKPHIPAWLREQEELQKSSLLDHHNTGSTAPRDQLTQSHSSHHTRPKKRTASAAQRIQFLDDDSDEEGDHSEVEDGALSENARSAASIDRHHPFFQHSRDANKRGVDLNETLSKLVVENAVAKAERDSKYGGSKGHSEGSTAQGNSTVDNRPSGRSKTVRDSSKNGTSNVQNGPPVIPPRRKGEVFQSTFASGTYPGFGKSARVEGPTVGGLRQTPASKKADVGIPASVLAEREKMEKERAEKLSIDTNLQSTTPSLPPPMRRRISSNSQVSLSDSSATTPRSPREENHLPLSINSIAKSGTGIRERVSDLFKGDLQNISERHDWLARAAERAKGGPLNDARVGLMSSSDDEDDLNYDDAPEVDDDYLEERRREEREKNRYTMFEMGSHKGFAGTDNNPDDRATPLSRVRPSTQHDSSPLPQRRATDHIRRSTSGAGNTAHVRRSSLLARGSSSFSDEDDGGSALLVEDDAVTSDFDNGHRSKDALGPERHKASPKTASEQQGWHQFSQ